MWWLHSHLHHWLLVLSNARRTEAFFFKTQTCPETPVWCLMAARSQRASSGQSVWHAAQSRSPAPRRTAAGGTAPPARLQAPHTDPPSSSLLEETAAWSEGDEKKDVSTRHLVITVQTLIFSFQRSPLTFTGAGSVAYWWRLDVVDDCDSRWVQRLPG